MKSKILFIIAAAGLAFATHASAADVSGTWLREGGVSQVKFAACGGGALCGTVAWLKPGYETKAKVGQRIFFDMKPDGDGWKGSAFNPEDGQTYTGKMSLSGATLTTQGCAMGGMICKSTSWTRAN